jgi:hypothetical protein
MQYVKEAPERFIIQGLDSFSNPARAVILERGNLSLELLDIMAKDTHPAIKELALEKRQEAIKKQASGADLNKATRK